MGYPQYRKQFIHKISNDLTSSQASTAFGSPSGSLNLVPTAFNVDDCLNILLSGWGGVTNNGYFPTTVEQLPVSPDALQDASNGSDFYFMVLTKNFGTFKYGNYFGGSTSSEHVDGERADLTSAAEFTKPYVQVVAEMMTSHYTRCI